MSYEEMRLMLRKKFKIYVDDILVFFFCILKENINKITWFK